MKKYRLLPIISAILICLTLFSVSALPLAVSTDQDISTPAAKNEGERITLLIGGTDRASGLTDVLMLVTVQTDTGNACVLQIPRDTYAAYTEKNYKKINGAYGELGGEGLATLFAQSLDIKIDGYMILSPNAFRGAVDAIGGVEVDIKKNMYYSDPAQGLYINLKAGKQTLDGEKAEQLIRYRSGYANGDLGRMDMQKVFLVALAKKLKNHTSQADLLRVATSLMQGTDTNITPALALTVTEALKKSDEKNMVLITAAGESAEAKSGASYYSLSAPAMKEILEKYFNGGENFDSERLFLNKNNTDFGRIYEGYSQYTPRRADEIN